MGHFPHPAETDPYDNMTMAHVHSGMAEIEWHYNKLILIWNSSWNLLLNEREDTITSLQEQLRLVQKFDFDNKEFDLDNKELNLDNKEELIRHDMNSLAMEEQAGLKAELDALAKEETSLNNLLFSITDALSTVQVRNWDHLSEIFWLDKSDCPK